MSEPGAMRETECLGRCLRTSIRKLDQAAKRFIHGTGVAEPFGQVGVEHDDITPGSETRREWQLLPDPTFAHRIRRQDREIASLTSR